jgi:hypothetical protein
MSTIRSGLLIAVLASFAAPASAEVLYGVDFSASELYTIDTSTGAASLVASTGFSGMAGIAFDDDGTLYAIDVDFGSTTLFTIHPATGVTTAIGTTGQTGGEGALVYDTISGQLYSKANPISGGGPTVELIRINPATGLATVIGNMGFTMVESDPSGFEWLPDGSLLAFDPRSALADRMLTIDKTTGLATEIGPTGTAPGISSVGGVARDPDSGIYYMSDGVELHTVDSGTGAAAAIGPHGQVISGLSFGPELACMVGLDETSTLYDVNGDDGSGTNARATGVVDLGSLALSSGGTLYATRSTGNAFLYTVDIATGSATAVGALGIQQIEGGLDFHPGTGVLYGVNGDGASELFTINTTTGAATLVGPVEDEVGNPVDASALAFDAAGALYALKTGTAPELYRLDPSDANVLEMLPIPGFPAGIDVAGMEFDDASGALYVALDGDLVVVNPVTGGSTVLGATPVTSALEIVTACGAAPVPSGSDASRLALIALLVVAAGIGLGRRLNASV